MPRCAMMQENWKKNFWWKFLVEKNFPGPGQSVLTMHKTQLARINWKIKSICYGLATRGLYFLKKSDAKRPFSPPCRNWPIYVFTDPTFLHCARGEWLYKQQHLVKMCAVWCHYHFNVTFSIFCKLSFSDKNATKLVSGFWIPDLLLRGVPLPSGG